MCSFFPDFFRKAEENAAAVLRRHRRPRTGFEGCARGFRGSIHIFSGGVWSARDHLFSRGIDHVITLPFGARLPLAIDEEVVGLYVRLDSGSQTIAPCSNCNRRGLNVPTARISKKEKSGQ